MSYSIAIRGYTPEQFFKLRLTGKPMDLQRKLLSREIDGLVKKKIFERSLNKRHTYDYRCLYPVRIWYHNGKGAYARINRDWLTPGDIWTF